MIQLKPEELIVTRNAEAALLAAILLEPECITKVKSQIDLADIYTSGVPLYSIHYRIYNAMVQCEHPDQITVAQKLQELGTLQPHDCAYLCHLVAEYPVSYLDYEQFIKQVRENADRRNGIRTIKQVYGGIPIE